MPAALSLYRNWFRVRMRGLENLPGHGAALVVANHSGVLPLDAIMLQAGVFADHPAHRNLRLLGADLVYELPVLAGLARRSGHTRAAPACAEQLLAAGELVGVFPEGFKGIGKPFRERYQLQRFGRGGFARTAIGAQRADRAVRDRRRRGDLPDDRQLEPGRPAAAAAVLPDHAAVPLARADRRRAAAVQLDHRVLPAGADVRLPGRGRG